MYIRVLFSINKNQQTELNWKWNIFIPFHISMLLLDNKWWMVEFNHSNIYYYFFYISLTEIVNFMRYIYNWLLYLHFWQVGCSWKRCISQTLSLLPRWIIKILAIFNFHLCENDWKTFYFYYFSSFLFISFRFAVFAMENVYTEFVYRIIILRKVLFCYLCMYTWNRINFSSSS